MKGPLLLLHAMADTHVIQCLAMTQSPFAICSAALIDMEGMLRCVWVVTSAALQSPLKLHQMPGTCHNCTLITPLCISASLAHGTV